MPFEGAPEKVKKAAQKGHYDEVSEYARRGGEAAARKNAERKAHQGLVAEADALHKTEAEDGIGDEFYQIEQQRNFDPED